MDFLILMMAGLMMMIYGDWNWTSRDMNLCWSSLQLLMICNLGYALLEEDLWIDL
jgi:hypothetical protein